MLLSLRARVFLLVAGTNLLVFAAVGYVLVAQAGDRAQTLQSQANEQIDFLRQVALGPRREVNAEHVLEWPGWPAWEDSMFVVGEVQRRPSGRYAALGLALNPVGAVRRDADFDEQAVLASLHTAIAENEAVEGAGGRAVPVGPGDAGAAPWGGVWYVTRAGDGAGDVARRLLPWFLATTLAATLISFYTMRKLVLEPVEDLAQGAARVRAGDLSTRLADPHRTDEIAELVRSFNEMTATVQGAEEHLREEVARATLAAREAESAAMTQRRLAAMGELAAGIAHEINNPLGGLQNAVEALGKGDLPPERRTRYIGLLRDGLERIRETVQRLLRFTPRPQAETRVDLGVVALDAMDLCRHRAQEGGVEVVLALPGGRQLSLPDLASEAERRAVAGAVPDVPGGRSELGQAVLNLLQNALDALEEAGAGGGRVELTLAAGRDEVVLRVRDDGPGVPEEDLARVSDLFYTTKDVGRGSGLGLAIVHNVVDSHRGRLRLSNDPEGGFAAEIHLPRGPVAGGAGP